MLAATADGIPTGPGWIHEVKWDGMRALVEVHGGTATCWSRSERDITVAFPELVGLGALYEDMLLDGEIVVLDRGRPSFEALAERFHVLDRRRAATLAASRPATYMAFDLLRLYGVDLTGRRFADRRATLERLDLAGPHWQVPPTFADGPALLDGTAAQGLEGIVSKRLDAPYRPGRRSEDWVKTAHRTTSSYVVGGWRPETGNAAVLGAVLVGVPSPGGLTYRGRVGSGLAGKAGAALLADLQPLTEARSPFVGAIPPDDADGTTWVAPVLVVDVVSLGVNRSGRLRQASYRGPRPDMTAGDIDESPVGPGDARAVEVPDA